MKKALLLLLSLLLLSLLLLASAHLQAAPATLNITSERGVPFSLRFDGCPLTRGGVRQVYLDRLAPGMHWAEFVLPAAYGRSVSFRTRLFLEPGLETSFVLLTRPGFVPELRQVAAVPLRGGRLPAPVPGSYPGGGPYGGPLPQPAPVPGGYGSGGYGSGGYGSGGYEPGAEAGYGTDDYGTDGYYPGGVGRGYNRVMAPQDVTALQAAVRRQSFDKDKLPLLQQALRETAIRADDLALLMQELSFESSRLELAKYGAGRVADRQNLYRLNDGFAFSATVREFQQYLAQQP